MGRNCIKKKGFTLLEVIISMTIISILSVGIYTGYMIMIRETKDGQAKQEAALEGKKVAEALEAADFKIGGDSITVGNMIFNKNQATYVRYLNKDYKDTEDDRTLVTKDTARYIESVTFSSAVAKTATTSDAVTLNTNTGLNSKANKIYISREKDLQDYKDYISYWKYDESKNYNPQTDDKKKNISLLDSSEMQLSMYLTRIDSSNENINVIDYTGKNLIKEQRKISDNIVINFSNYKNADGTLPSNENIEINVYNETSSAANIYLEKQMNLNVDLEKRKGEVNLYNNRAENVSQDDMGTLYNIEISITDNKSDNLFTGYYKKNIH
ncbi:type II secretion system protein [Clostridium beijerinckii]|uniref:Prepilin-type N-terminal cleavage/methylation domain-containing protein n=1 Tax=Clostridium beijerinckii TaxID=1520 RepID=A0A1S8S007_CLOBE|nr:type II secretion system protein [Clostridium beijerinckii]NRY59956.1 prepilin-type N-terminal cleavage/methylation domain-containing protein [Clostridium beijerinckii]OOM58784.1 hypothetical protein CLBCK_38200 [Clostridium beijerinckii]